jgi:ADP-ribosylglycohydrolase
MRDLDRARGVLWGQAVGDAVGTTQEFTPGERAMPFPAINVGPQTDMVGGGPYGLDPGMVTDDTHMAVCLAESLATRGRLDPDDLARRYLDWRQVTFDIGNQTDSALFSIEKGTPPLEAGRRLWEAMKHQPAANGSLMRTSPIPVFFADDPVALRRAALDDASITHADPRCRLACAAFGAAIRHALVDPGATAESMRLAARAELPLAALAIEPTTPPALVAQAVTLLGEDLELATHPDPELMGPTVHLTRHAGYVRVAFRLAFWELLHAPSFEAAVLDCANRGGDADTNAAIAGALEGALRGERAIRADWRERVEQACQHRKWHETPWPDRYHPRRLFSVLTGSNGSSARP